MLGRALNRPRKSKSSETKLTVPGKPRLAKEKIKRKKQRNGNIVTKPL